MRTRATIGRLLAAAACAALAAGCGGDDFDASDGGTDAGTDAGADTDTDTDVDSDTDADTDTDTDTDTDSDEAGPGEPCWKELFGVDHPNFGLPDCVEGYVCIGDGTGAWCTETCDSTGDVNSSTSPFDGWCCAEFSDACDPSRFWVPAELNTLCIPRTAGAAAACDQEGTWPSSAERCAPICDGTTLVSETVCQAASETEFFCTFACNPDDVQCEALDDTIGDGFTGGCCQVWGVSNLCTPADLCL